MLALTGRTAGHMLSKVSLGYQEIRKRRQVPYSLLQSNKLKVAIWCKLWTGILWHHLRRELSCLPPATPFGAWSQPLMVARDWIGLGKWCASRIIPLLFTGVLCRQITSLICSPGRVQKCLSWHTGSRGGGGGRIVARHTQGQFNTLGLQSK